jgi:hypothetical protein
MVNSTAKFYAQNLVVWNSWSIVYSIFACLIAAVNGKDISSNPFFNGSIAGAQQQIFVGLTSILYSVCILLIPVISFFILGENLARSAGLYWVWSRLRIRQRTLPGSREVGEVVLPGKLKRVKEASAVELIEI